MEGLEKMGSKKDFPSLFECIENGNVVGLKNLVQDSTTDINEMSHEGYSALHTAVKHAQLVCLDLLLRQYNIKINIADEEGNTALHLATDCDDLEAVQLLISAGANVFATNKEGNQPVAYAKSQEVENYLIDRMSLVYNSSQISRINRKHITDIQELLPEDPVKLKQFSIELIIGHHFFQERCKETIHQLVEEKHITLHKNRLLEYAAEIPDSETGQRFIDQLQFLHDENEQQDATISFLKNKVRLLENSAMQQEEYFRKHIADLTQQHNDQIKAILKRSSETEKAFLDFQSKHSQDMAELAFLRSERNVEGRQKDIPFVSEDSSIANSDNFLEKKLNDTEAEKLAVIERLKLAEKLKSIAESENIELRNVMNQLRSSMQEDIMKRIQNMRVEQDEKDEETGAAVFIKDENGNKELRGATPEKLLQRLTDASNYDAQFLQSFMLTFRSFMSCDEVLKGILNKYPFGGTYKVEVQSNENNPAVLRLCNTLKYWIENYWEDFQATQLMEDLSNFVEDMQPPNLSILLKSAMARKRRSSKSLPVNSEELFHSRPKPILPKYLLKKYPTAELTSSDRTGTIVNRSYFGKIKDDEKVRLMDLDALEIARQLTLIEFDLFKSIKAREFLDLAWMKDNKETQAPNLCKMMRWSNHVIHWVVSEVVSVRENTKIRASVLEKFILVAQHLEKLNNFNGLKEIIAGLQSSALYRLKKTKQALGSKYLRMMDQLVKEVSSDLNYKNLRARVHASQPPVIPFPGVYQSDLVFLDSGSKSILEGNLVNFHKYQKIATYIFELTTFQQSPYNFEPIAEIHEYVRDCKELDDETAYHYSLLCEPRE